MSVKLGTTIRITAGPVAGDKKTYTIQKKRTCMYAEACGAQAEFRKIEWIGPRLYAVYLCKNKTGQHGKYYTFRVRLNETK